MYRGDFQTHSVLDDGKSTLEEMAAAAHGMGLTHFGFSGHSYGRYDGDFCIPNGRVQEYLDTARALQRRYAGEMEVFVGLELDLYGEKPEGLDYVIGSVHGVIQNGVHYPVDKSPEDSLRAVREGFGGDWYRYTDAYYDLVATLPDVTGCSWLGHFDLVTKFNEQVPAFDEESPRYLRRAMEVMEYLVKRGAAFEVNTGAVARGYRNGAYPAPRLLRHLRELGGEIILNSDAHHASQVCFGFSQAESAIRAAGFDHTNLWTRNGLMPIGLE